MACLSKMEVHILTKSVINSSSFLRAFRREYSSLVILFLGLTASNLCSYRDSSFANEFMDTMNSSSLCNMCDIDSSSCTNLLNNSTGLIEYFPEAWRIVFFLWLFMYGRFWPMILSQSKPCNIDENLRDILSAISAIEARSPDPRISLISCPMKILLYNLCWYNLT